MTSILTQPKRDELGQMLDAAGSVYDPEGVGALIAGVLAAPAVIGASRQAANRVGRPPFGRVHCAARRRASGRIRATAWPAPRLADRLLGLGRPCNRVARSRGAVRRRAL